MAEDHARVASLLRDVIGVADASTRQAVLMRAVGVIAQALHARAVVVRWCPGDDEEPLLSATGVTPAAGDSHVLDAVTGGAGPVRGVQDPTGDVFLSQLDAPKVAVLALALREPGAGAVLVARPLAAGEFTDADQGVATAVATQVSLALGRLESADERDRLVVQLRTAERLKTEFVAMTSHELRTPLTSIRAATSMIRSYWDTINDDRKHRLLEVIEGQAQRLSRLVDNILTAANLESGVMLPRITTVDVAAAAHDVARDFTVELDLIVDVDRPLETEADADHVRQILVNLVGNSLKYGKPPVAIVGRRVRDCIEIRVTDQGPGVPPEFVARLFDRFTQASVGDGRHVSGSGLGLSIAKGLAEASGGTVRYEPTQPVGSSFVLTLPAAS